nr:hypothetical protein [Tanacetum cinerariifolium]
MAQLDRHGAHYHNGVPYMKINDLLVERHVGTPIVGSLKGESRENKRYAGYSSSGNYERWNEKTREFDSSRNRSSDLAGTDLVTPAGTDLVTPAETDLVTPAGTDLVTPAGTDLVIPAGTDLVTPAGTDLLIQQEPI